MQTLKYIGIGLAALALLFALWAAYAVPRIITLAKHSRELAAETVPYATSTVERAPWVLVVGDSTAVGVGARDPSETVAGRMAADMAPVNLLNRAQNGAQTADVLTQFSERDGAFDLILIQIGANDVLWFTGFTELSRDLERVLALASQLSDHVVLLSGGNIGASPMFVPPLDWVYAVRSRQVRDLFARKALEFSAIYIDLWRPVEADPFAREPDKYFAPDLLHITGAAYGLWYEEIRPQLMSRAPELMRQADPRELFEAQRAREEAGE